MLTRRHALRNVGLGAGALALAPFAEQLRAEATGDPVRLPKRFVFIVRSNGILASEIQPEELQRLVKTRSNGGWQSKGHVHRLADYTLHDAMAPLQSIKDRVSIFQGLSGKMCSGSHGAGFGALGAYTGNARMATIDGALARALSGVFPHLGFEMATNGQSVSYPGLSAFGPKQQLPYYADPMLAYANLFGTTATDASTRASLDIDRNVLDFMVDDVKRFQVRLSSREKEKLDHYLHGFEAMQKRQAKLVAMSKTLAQVAPELRDRFTSEVNTERLKAHFDVAASSLIGGLTQVVSIKADDLRMRIEGFGLESKTVHELGHMIEGGKGGGGATRLTTAWASLPSARSSSAST